MEKIKILMLKLFGFGLGSPSKRYLFSEETEMGIMTKKTKHD
jgi:hypothetical protein